MASFVRLRQFICESIVFDDTIVVSLEGARSRLDDALDFIRDDVRSGMQDAARVSDLIANARRLTLEALSIVKPAG